MIFNVQSDPSRFLRWADRTLQGLQRPMNQPDLRGGAVEAEETYLGAMRRRFASASHGDGTWPDIKPSTKLQRYYEAGGRFKRQKGVTRLDRLRFVASLPFPILYVSGETYSSLVPGAAGSLFEVMSDRVRGGTTVHHAHYHQEGGGRLPRRAILVDPDAQLCQQMSAPIVKGYQNFLTSNV